MCISLKKMPYFGGNSAINGGLFAAPGTPMQQQEGVKDSVEQMVADQLKSGRGIADEELLRHVASHAVEALQMTLDAGAEYHPYLQQLGGHSVARTYQPRSVAAQVLPSLCIKSASVSESRPITAPSLRALSSARMVASKG